MRILTILLWSALASGDASVAPRGKALRGWSGCAAKVETARVKMVQRGYPLFEGAVIDLGSPWIWVDFLDGRERAHVMIGPSDFVSTHTRWIYSSVHESHGWVAELSCDIVDPKEQRDFARELQAAADACLADPTIGSASKNQPK